MYKPYINHYPYINHRSRCCSPSTKSQASRSQTAWSNPAAMVESSWVSLRCGADDGPTGPPTMGRCLGGWNSAWNIGENVWTWTWWGFQHREIIDDDRWWFPELLGWTNKITMCRMVHGTSVIALAIRFHRETSLGVTTTVLHLYHDWLVVSNNFYVSIYWE